MISLAPILAALRQKPAGFTGQWFRQVDTAARYAQIPADALPLPAAWVVREADRPRQAGEQAEDTAIRFAVVIGILNSTRPGEDGDEEMLRYRRAVFAALEGALVAADTGPIQWDGGQILDYTAGDLYWRDSYTLDALLTNYLPDPPQNFGGLNYTSTLPE